jgi:uncharacterized protein (DUF697 family)
MPEHQDVLIARFRGTVPAAGTNEVQTLTIGGTPLAGDTFRIRRDGMPTAPIPWSAVNATLLASMVTALNAAFGTGSVVPTAGTLAAGIGTILLTYGGKLSLLAVTTATVTTTLVGGSTMTAVIAETTPGVTATYRQARRGMILQSDDGNNYRNSSATPSAPTWVAM